MTTYFHFVLKHRLLILAFIALLTLAAGKMMMEGVFASSVGRMFLGEHPDYHRYVERARDFGSTDVIVVAFEEPDPFFPSTQSSLQRAANQIAAIPYIRRVQTILDSQYIEETEEGIAVRKYARDATARPGETVPPIERCRKDPLVSGLLVSSDGGHIALVIELDAESDLPAEEIPGMIDGVYRALERAGYARDEVRAAGLAVSVAMVISESQFNIKRLFPITCLILLIVVWVMFRRFWPMIMTMTVAMIAVIWTMGFSVLLDRHISVLVSMVPAVILIISFSDVIHLCSSYLLELGRGKSKEKAILASGEDVGRACLLTSLTTFTGFVSLSLIPTPIFRQLGVVLGFGVGIALLIAVTLVPILFSLIPEPKPWRTGATGRVQDKLDFFLGKAAALSSRRPWLVVAAFSAFAVFSMIGVARLKVETDFVKRVGEDHPLRADGHYFQSRFSGTTAMDVFIEAPEPDGLLDSTRFKRIAAYQDALEALPEVSRAYSLVDLIETIHRALSAGDPAAGRLPETREALAQYLLLFEMAGGEELDKLLDFNRQTMRMTLILPGEAVRSTFFTGVKVRSMASEHLDDGVEVEVTGILYLIGQWLDDVVAGQRRGLGFAVAVITLMMMVGLRSLRAGLWSMIPNLFPLLILGGYLGLFWEQVDSDLMALGMIAIGIGVDDTIHFLMRFRIESRRCKDVQTAIEQTFHFSGRGIVITTVILVAGFTPFAMSKYLSINIMGTLLPMTLVVALLADLFFVPALIKIGAIRFAPTNDKYPSPPAP